MPRVQSYQEIIQFPAPTAEVFTTEITAIRRDLASMAGEGAIRGAIIFGSAAYGDAKPGSDIDIIITSPELSLELLDGVRSMVSRVYDRSGIPLDPSCRTERELLSGEHNQYFEPMIGWLCHQAARFPETIVGENLLHLIHPPQIGAIQGAAGYLTKEVRKFSQAYMAGEDAGNASTLEDVLNTPHKLGREAVAALQHYDYIPAGTLKKASRLAVVEAVKSTLGKDDPEIAELCSELSGASEAYDTLVEAVRSGDVGQAEYEQVVVVAARQGLPRALALAIKMRAAYHRYIYEK